MEMDSMPSMTFMVSTSTPLYSNAWTPSSTAGYAGTCIFLIVLASIYRGLIAFKHVLEARWIDIDLQRRYVVVADASSVAEEVRTDGNAEKMRLLSEKGVEEDVRVVRTRSRAVRPWRVTRDPIRATVVTVTAGIQYLLMLSVMTCNVGYFMSVLGGIFLGELVVGRYGHGEEH